MQTFMPLPDYYQSAAHLDVDRLGNQAWNEGMILFFGGWSHHVASKMWRGHRYHLGLYVLACFDALRWQWQRTYPHHVKRVKRVLRYTPDSGPPPWFGDAAFHAAHRSNLLRKDPEWYGQFGWQEPNDLPYIWPTNE